MTQPSELWRLQIHGALHPFPLRLKYAYSLIKKKKLGKLFLPYSLVARAVILLYILLLLFKKLNVFIWFLM